MNIDQTRKVVSIVLMVLIIGTMVFNAFHLVGHCADSSQSVPIVSGFPLVVNGFLGVPSDCSYVQAALPLVYSMAISDNIFHESDSSYTYFNCINEYEVASDYSYVVVECRSKKIDSYNFEHYPPTFSISGSLSDFPSVTIGFTFENSSSYGKRYTINSDGSVTRGYTFNPKTYSNAVSDWLQSTPTNGYSYKSTMYKYPLWFSDNFYSVPLAGYSDVFPFVKSSSGSSIEGHSKGGNITEYSFDQTDEPEPSDPSAVAGSGGWLSKILGGLNKLNKTIGDGFTNLVDNLQSFFNPIFGAFELQIDNFKSAIESKLDDIIVALGGDLNTSDSSLSDTFLTAFQGSKSYGVVTTYNQGKQLVSGLFNSVPTPDTLRFEFDLPTMNLSGHSQGGSSNPTYITKPYGSKLVMDFSWYENVRSIVVPFIIAWLYAGMLIWLLRAIPGFISGSPSINTRSVSDGSPIINGHNEVYEYTDFQGQHHKKPIFRL